MKKITIEFLNLSDKSWDETKNTIYRKINNLLEDELPTESFEIYLT